MGWPSLSFKGNEYKNYISIVLLVVRKINPSGRRRSWRRHFDVLSWVANFPLISLAPYVYPGVSCSWVFVISWRSFVVCHKYGN